MENTNFVSMKSRVAEIMAAMKSTSGFQIKRELTDNVKAMAAAVSVGDMDTATKLGNEVVKAGSALLRSFIRNSVFDQEETAEKPARVSRFNAEIRKRATDSNGPYDGDIIARLEKLKITLENSVRTETNGVFAQRIEAYNAMCKGLEEADEQQKKLDRTRMEVMKQKARTTDILSGRPKVTIQRTANLLAAEEAQQRRRDELKKESEEILALL